MLASQIAQRSLISKCPIPTCSPWRQLWITYHLSGNEGVQAGWRSQKAAKGFISGGTTLNDVNFQVVKRVGKDFEVNGSFTLEHWKAPVYLPGQHTVTAASIQFVWYPARKIAF